MTDIEKYEMLKKCVNFAAKKTAVRMPGVYDVLKANREDIIQDTYIEYVERKINGKNINASGDVMTEYELMCKSANCVLRRYCYDKHGRRKAEIINDYDNDENNDKNDILQSLNSDNGKYSPENRTIEMEEIKTILSIVPDAYKEDAPKVLYFVACGYTAPEIARKTNNNPRRIQRIIKAIQNAGEQYRNAV